jgi:hypothetical protein
MTSNGISICFSSIFTIACVSDASMQWPCTISIDRPFSFDSAWIHLSTCPRVHTFTQGIRWSSCITAFDVEAPRSASSTALLEIIEICRTSMNPNSNSHEAQLQLGLCFVRSIEREWQMQVRFQRFHFQRQSHVCVEHNERSHDRACQAIAR